MEMTPASLPATGSVPAHTGTTTLPPTGSVPAAQNGESFDVNSVAQNAASVNPNISNSTVQYSYGSKGEQAQGTNSTPVVSPFKTARTLAKDLCIGAALGTRKMDVANRNSGPKEVRGYYEQRAKYMAVREGEASNFGVTMHEAGHAIADKTGLTGTQEMIRNLDPAFAANYDAQALPGEAFAEFTSMYMQDSARGSVCRKRFYDAVRSIALQRRHRQGGLAASLSWRLFSFFRKALRHRNGGIFCIWLYNHHHRLSRWFAPAL